MSKLFFFKQERCGKRLYLDEVVYLATEGNYTKVYLTYGSTVTLCCSLKSLLGKLPGDLFTQIHRSTIVALQYITEIHNEYVMTPLKQLPVAKQFRKPLRDRIDWLE